MSRPEPAFSNGTEWEIWSANWCDRCLVEAPFRNGLKGATGCPLIVTAMSEVPAEWFTPEPGTSSDRYRCLNFKGPGGRSPEPRPCPEPTGMDGLFSRPPRQVRMFTQPVPVEAVSHV